jgi:ABC-type microcin C transport system duplicated ATPase subunit YejF
MNTPDASTSERALTVLQVNDLAVHFPVKTQGAWRKSGVVRAVDGISLTLRANETVGLVGESGCGKSTLARAVIRLVSATGGEILFEGRDIARLSERQLGDLRANMQMVFQDPASSLNPRMTVEKVLAEPMRIAGWDWDRIAARNAELLRLSSRAIFAVKV